MDSKKEEAESTLACVTLKYGISLGGVLMFFALTMGYTPFLDVANKEYDSANRISIPLMIFRYETICLSEQTLCKVYTLAHFNDSNGNIATCQMKLSLLLNLTMPGIIIYNSTDISPKSVTNIICELYSDPAYPT